RGLLSPAVLEFTSPGAQAQAVEELALLGLGGERLVGQVRDDAERGRVGAHLRHQLARARVGRTLNRTLSDEQADLLAPLVLDGRGRREGDSWAADAASDLQSDQRLAGT